MHRKPPLYEVCTHLAARKQVLALMKVLLDAGAQTDLQNTAGHTPLHLASMMGDQDMVEVLLEAGADVFIVDYDNRAPIFMAAQRGFSG